MPSSKEHEVLVRLLRDRPEILRTLLEAQGVEKGLAEGVAAARSALRGVLAARGLTVTRGQRRTIETCADLSRLQAWIVRAATASSADEVFA